MPDVFPFFVSLRWQKKSTRWISQPRVVLDLESAFFDKWVYADH